MGGYNLPEFVARLITAALREVNTKEATGRNDGVPSLRYQKDPYAKNVHRRVAWCALFVMWVYDQIPHGPRLHHSRKQWWRYASVFNFHEAWKGCSIEDNGRFDIEPGDILIFNDRGESDPDATGWHMAIAVATTEDRILSVDGNWANKVDVVVREADDAHLVDVLRIR